MFPELTDGALRTDRLTVVLLAALLLLELTEVVLLAVCLTELLFEALLSVPERVTEVLPLLLADLLVAWLATTVLELVLALLCGAVITCLFVVLPETFFVEALLVLFR